MYHSLIIHSSLVEHLGCLGFLACVNRAATYMAEQVSVKSSPLGYARSGIQEVSFESQESWDRAATNVENFRVCK